MNTYICPSITRIHTNLSYTYIYGRMSPPALRYLYIYSRTRFVYVYLQYICRCSVCIRIQIHTAYTYRYIKKYILFIHTNTPKYTLYICTNTLRNGYYIYVQIHQNIKCTIYIHKYTKTSYV